MKFRSSVIAGSLLAFLAVAGSSLRLTSVAFAQASSSDLPSIEAVITAPEDGPAGRPILLDASQSRLFGDNRQYLWYVSGGAAPISQTVDAIYTPEETGPLRFRLIIRAVVNGKTEEAQAVHDMTIFKKKMVLIADREVPDDKILAHVQAASGAGLFLQVLRSPVAASSTDAFARFLEEQGGALRGAEAIVLWTDALSGVQSLVTAIESDAGRAAELHQQSIVLVTGNRLATIAQTLRASYAMLKPQRIVLIHPDVLDPLLLSSDLSTFVSTAQARDLSISVVDDNTAPVPPWQVLSLLVNYMLLHGMSSQTVLLLLMLPVIATILSFLKQVIGVVTYGLFAPAIVALSFLALGWLPGLLFFLFIAAAGYLSRAAVTRMHILYIPKMAIIITLISLSLLLLLAGTLVFKLVLAPDTVFVLLIMSTLSESFLTAKTEEGWITALLGIGQTLIAALLCVFIVQWPSFQALMLAYPELLLFTIVINIIVGRYTGLRLSEYVRFREVFRHMATHE